MEPIISSLSNPENRDVTLGMIAEKLNEMDQKSDECWKNNDKEHTEFKKRLDEGDQYLFIFKMSKCTLTWLDQNGAIKWVLILLAFWAIDWFNRAYFWSQRGVP